MTSIAHIHTELLLIVNHAMAWKGGNQIGEVHQFLTVMATIQQIKWFAMFFHVEISISTGGGTVGPDKEDIIRRGWELRTYMHELKKQKGHRPFKRTKYIIKRRHEWTYLGAGINKKINGSNGWPPKIP